MKLFCTVLLAIALQSSVKGYSQGITLSLKNAPLEKAFKLIEQQTSYKFVYSTEAMALAKPVSVSVENETLENTLNICFAHQSLGYILEDELIIVRVAGTGTESHHTVDSAAHKKIKGKVVTTVNGTPVAGALVTMRQNAITAMTDQDGNFEIIQPSSADTLVISHVSYATEKTAITAHTTSLVISLSERVNEISDVTVSTGYQSISKERVTGSFDVVNNKLINRSVSPNVLNHIENLTPGVLFDRNTNAPDPLLIRGRSTIYANAAPLIVLNNFPYDGNINNINPNDVESITILKDAAAASIWGARAGNGVIVITTKKGNTSDPRVVFNASVTFLQKPGLFNVHTISSSDYIDVEKYLFSQGYYDYAIASPDHQPLTPVTEILLNEREGLITPDEADKQINSFRGIDVRNDMDKYLYQTGVNQQYSLNVSGISRAVNYYFSAGWDRGSPVLQEANNNRITLRNYTAVDLTNKLKLTTNVSLAVNNNSQGNNPGYNISLGGGRSAYPYAQLADANGTSVNIVKDYRSGWTDTVGGGQLLNWKYNPVTDMGAQQNVNDNVDALVNAILRYRLTSYLNAEIYYQYESITSNVSNLHTLDAYFTRNLINKYAQLDPETGIYSYPVPMGGIRDVSNTRLNSHQGRIQFNFQKDFNHNNITALAGWEIKSLHSSGYENRFYGYDEDKNLVNTNVDYITAYPLLTSPFNQEPVPAYQSISGTTDHFISVYANGAYTYRNRYTLSASAREDEANLFGVKANKKGTPLWSAGALWQIDKEQFYNFPFLPILQFKLSYGCNGNISRIASAYATASYYGAITTPLPAAYINNPPNDELQWEQINIFNATVNFQTKNDVLEGTVEYYRKHSSNLLGQAPVDPTLGLSNGSQSFYYGNVAAMKGYGWDINLTSNNLKGRFSWTTNVIFSVTQSKVSKYLMPISASGSTYLPEGLGFINPVIGKPLFAVYSFQWGGLDPSTGDPIGYYQGKQSTSYADIYANTPLDSLVYNGPLQPVYYGAVRNSFAWKGFELSFNISFKAGYYFRTASLMYNELYSSWTGSGDYAKRWQQPGDEKNTHVPSMIYPDDVSRDAFYQNASILVQKGDNIRFEDINLSYYLSKQQWKALPLKEIKFYAYVYNLGSIYLANSLKIDPYYNNLPSTRGSFSIGLTATF